MCIQLKLMIFLKIIRGFLRVLPQTFLAQGSGLISFVINWPIFGNAKSGDDTGGYSSNNA
jgi:hypothetical protein